MVIGDLISTRQASAVDSAATPARRLVLLGASNLTKRLGSVIATARQSLGAPSEILAALGRGRSYGGRHRFLGRELPGILHCGVWSALGASSAAPTTALVTDIGNDILYDYPVALVAGWIDECLARLQDVGAKTVITRLPVDNLRSLSERRFLFFRQLMVPHCRLTLALVRERAYALDQRVAELGERRGAVVVAQKVAWYGFDPMHIRRSQATLAWQTVWKSLQTPKTPDFQAISLAERARLALIEPAESKRFGRSRSARQPVARLSDGATIAVY